MTTQNLALFKAVGAKMDFLNQRQRIIAQNVSNADTPGYRPEDMVPVDFNRVLKSITNDRGVFIAATRPGHMPSPSEIDNLREDEQKQTYEVAPAGNAVIMEEQLVKAQNTVMDYNLMSNIYKKHVGMMQTALGVGR